MITRLLLIPLILVLIVLIIIFRREIFPSPFSSAPQNNSSPSASPSITPSPFSASVPPLNRYWQRLLLRKYGQLVTLQDRSKITCGASFTGYHTGDDLEVFPDESDAIVPVVSALEGRVVDVSDVSGYGGLVVASGRNQEKPVTLYYGHLDLKSVSLKPGDHLSAGQYIGNLGRACSSETGGERKHLHFALRQGTAVNLKGYVPSASDLQNWLDPAILFPSE